MKILIANLPMDSNRFLIDLKEGFEKHAEVCWDYEEFWSCKNQFDIVHIHWPEYFSHELWSYTQNKLPMPEELWKKLIDCLEHWSTHSKIIYTRHVQYPHNRHDEEFLKIYRIVSGYCHTVVHFANYSIQQFKEFYPEHTHVKHTVIPHHNYESLPNNSDKTLAREKLGIGHNKNVMLVFGTIKEPEKELISLAFNSLPKKSRVLLAPGWKVPRRKIGYIRLREWVWKIEKLLARFKKNKIINLGFIPEEEAHLYLNAADFLLIPRTTELNSGNITCGFTFGLVVVGKNDADIGEILKETNNPTFKVGDNESLNSAIEKALLLNKQNHGAANKKIAIENWDVASISKQYIDVMISAMNE